MSRTDQDRTGHTDGATVLFVDDEPWIVSGLGRVLHQAHPGWRALFATSGDEALSLLADTRVDVIVVDMRMPGMNGIELLAAVQSYHPEVARLVLSGYADRDLLIASAGPAQQFLPKPIDADSLIAAVNRVLRLNNLVDDPALRDRLGGVSALPKPPEVYRRITEITEDPDYELDDVIDVISSDLATTAEVLRLVNSAYFGLLTRVDSVAQAVGLLGVQIVQALAVADSVFRTGPVTPPGLDAAELTRHGLAVATTARRIAQSEEWPDDAVSHMFIAGLLHQIGLPVLAAAHPERWQAVRGLAPTDLWAEDDLWAGHFGCSVTQASAFLLGLWEFPDGVVHAVADQPAGPNASPAAHLLTYARHCVREPVTDFPAPSDGYLDRARLGRWQCVARGEEARSAPARSHAHGSIAERGTRW
ncbi:MAG TPA: HDOD domain-containing protein [Kineosporiaceae bacterium]|nr:HDOD domain-containing protein [Kineosporiaceae bacterium]